MSSGYWDDHNEKLDVMPWEQRKVLLHDRMKAAATALRGFGSDQILKSWQLADVLHREEEWVPYAPWWPFDGSIAVFSNIQALNPRGYRIYLEGNDLPGRRAHWSPPEWPWNSERLHLDVENDSTVAVTLTLRTSVEQTIVIDSGTTVRVGPFIMYGAFSSSHFSCDPTEDVSVRWVLVDVPDQELTEVGSPLPVTVLTP